VLEDDVNYFRRRAAEERAAADRAASQSARDAHIGLAERYDELARAIDAHAPYPVDLNLRSV